MLLFPLPLLLCLTTCCSLTTVCNRDSCLGHAIASFCWDLSRRCRAIHSSCYVVCRTSSLQQVAVCDWPPFPSARYVLLYVLFDFSTVDTVYSQRLTLRRRHPDPIPTSPTA
ncbi:hypothetical protein V6N12_049242 [Hibiscus sabdariffa]|uniref:Secreted protein n=1 Tax=Hibiscus sabdariffa TaxID=183260 RepID=A0ABR2EJM6_9ROSI